MAVEGIGPYQIARILTEEKVESPSDGDRQSFAEYQMKTRDRLSFREEIKVLLRNAMNRPENKSLQDVIDYEKKYYLMDVRLRGNTISYALKYRTDKKGKPMSVRGSRLGARFTVAGITEYLKKKEKSRLEYERIKADIEQESGRYDDYAEWDISDVKESVGIDTAGSVQKKYEKTEGDISVYDEFLEELEARKKYHGTKAYGRQSTMKYDREGR